MTPPEDDDGNDTYDEDYALTVRQDLEQAIRDPQARIIVNFDRAALDQEGYGHFSPLASFSVSQNAFLLLDVAKYKYPPVWVPANRLVAAMATVDACGDWDFPAAQDELKDKWLKPNTTARLEKARHKLGCKSTLRGYVIVKQK